MNQTQDHEQIYMLPDISVGIILIVDIQTEVLQLVCASSVKWRDVCSKELTIDSLSLLFL